MTDGLQPIKLLLFKALRMLYKIRKTYMSESHSKYNDSGSDQTDYQIVR